MIAFATARGTGASGTAGQREVRAESAVFPGDAEREKFIVDGGGQVCELRAGFDANPEDTGRFGSGEKSVGTKADFGGGPYNRAHCFLDFVEGGVGLLADELKSDVKGFRFHPACVRRKLADALDEQRDAIANRVIDVESGKKAHKSSMSNALEE